MRIFVEHPASISQVFISCLISQTALVRDQVVWEGRSVMAVPISIGVHFLIKPTIKRSNTAPIIAVIIEPIKPDAEIPRNPNTKPPSTAPTIPTMILPRRPKPSPFIKIPANHPETPPIARNIINPVISIVSPIPYKEYPL